MFPTSFFVEHWVSLLFGLLSIAIVSYCRFLNKKFHKFIEFEERKREEEIQQMIATALCPIKEDLIKSAVKFESIKQSYRYRLISLCEIYLDRGYLTPKEYSGLTEMWKVYHDLGGNSQAEDYYHKVEKLPVRDHHEEI